MQLFPPRSVSCGSENSLAGSCTAALSDDGASDVVTGASANASFSETALSATGGSFTANASCSFSGFQPASVNALSSASITIVVEAGRTATVTITGSLFGGSVYDGSTASVMLYTYGANKRSFDDTVPVNGSVVLGPGTYWLRFDADSSCQYIDNPRNTTATINFSIS